MTMTAQASPARRRPTTADLFTPKLVTVLREGYGLEALRADALAGLTVAIVALPLSMAIAIASGTTPERGLYTAIIGGGLISLLGGSRFQIGGPAAAFTVIVAGTIDRHGLDGLFVATLMSGVFLMLLGLLRCGSFVKFVPYPVTVGFISGIAVILLAGQVHDLLGLHLPGREPAEFLPKLQALSGSLATASPGAMAVAALTVAIIVGLRRVRPHWPGILIAVTVASLATVAFALPIETIGSRFGGIPGSLPRPALPPLSLEGMRAVLPDAIAFTLLGAIESLLSAMVADGMTGRRHRSNVELVAQGIANIGAALFGGICATGTVARTATNVRSGARGPLAGIMHAGFLVLFMLVAAPLARFIPLAGLAGVLVVVAWGMAEKHAFAVLLRTSRGDAIVLLATFGLTVFRSLSEAIVVGVALGAMVVIHRLAKAAAIEQHVPWASEDEPDDAAERAPYDSSAAVDPDVAVYRITGALFFGTAAMVASVQDTITQHHKVILLDFAAVPFIDSTAANAIGAMVATARRKGVAVVVSAPSAPVAAMLEAHGVTPPAVPFAPSLDQARRATRELLARAAAPTEKLTPTA